MMYYLSLITALSVIATGLYVLAKGDWHKFGLKFAGVAISTTAAIWLLGADLALGGNIISCTPNIGDQNCLTLEIYHVLRNMAFVVFHIAIGRDAIHFKQQDRRGAPECQKNSSKQLRLL